VRFTVGGVSVPFSQVTEDMQGQMSDDEYMVSRLEFYFSSRTDFHGFVQAYAKVADDMEAMG
jgi:hypothetical protein